MLDIPIFSFSHLGTGLIARYQCKGAKHIAPFHLDYIHTMQRPWGFFFFFMAFYHLLSSLSSGSGYRLGILLRAGMSVSGRWQHGKTVCKSIL